MYARCPNDTRASPRRSPSRVRMLCAAQVKPRKSAPNPEPFELPSQRIAAFGMVADGVGGHHGGETASRAAVETIAEYVKETMNAFYAADESDESAFFSALEEAAATCHQAV